MTVITKNKSEKFLIEKFNSRVNLSKKDLLEEYWKNRAILYLLRNDKDLVVRNQYTHIRVFCEEVIVTDSNGNPLHFIYKRDPKLAYERLQIKVTAQRLEICRRQRERSESYKQKNSKKK